MMRVAFASVLGAALVLGGCRSCDVPSGGAGDAAPAGPTMPAGMLLPNVAPIEAEASSGVASELRVAHHVKGGAFIELQIARPGDRADRSEFEHWRDDSSFVPLAAMALLHEAFARALPGFDLFLPRRFGGEVLARLVSELEAFAARTQGEIAGSAREIAVLARAASAKGDALWVLGI